MKSVSPTFQCPLTASRARVDQIIQADGWSLPTGPHSDKVASKISSLSFEAWDVVYSSPPFFRKCNFGWVFLLVAYVSTACVIANTDQTSCGSTTRFYASMINNAFEVMVVVFLHSCLLRNKKKPLRFMRMFNKLRIPCNFENSGSKNPRVFTVIFTGTLISTVGIMTVQSYNLLTKFSSLTIIKCVNISIYFEIKFAMTSVYFSSMCLLTVPYTNVIKVLKGKLLLMRKKNQLCAIPKMGKVNKRKQHQHNRQELVSILDKATVQIAGQLIALILTQAVVSSIICLFNSTVMDRMDTHSKASMLFHLGKYLFAILFLVVIPERINVLVSSARD